MARVGDAVFLAVLESFIAVVKSHDVAHPDIIPAETHLVKKPSPTKTGLRVTLLINLGS